MKLILEIFNSTNIDLDNLTPTQYGWDFDSPIIIFYLGLYFQYVNIDYTLMKSCYEKNIQLNSHSNSYAYYKLGNIIIKENENNIISDEAK